jgi:hypothetical protein
MISLNEAFFAEMPELELQQISIDALCAIMDETTSPSQFSIELKGGEQGQAACQGIEKPIQKCSRKQTVVVSQANINGVSWKRRSSVATGS